MINLRCQYVISVHILLDVRSARWQWNKINFCSIILVNNNESNNRSLIGKHRHQTWNQWTLMPTITIYACVLIPFSYSEQNIEEGQALIYEWNMAGHLMLTELKYIYCHDKELVTYTHRSESWWICKPIIELAGIAWWEDGCCYASRHLKNYA